MLLLLLLLFGLCELHDAEEAARSAFWPRVCSELPSFLIGRGALVLFNAGCPRCHFCSVRSLHQLAVAHFSYELVLALHAHVLSRNLLDVTRTEVTVRAPLMPLRGPG